MDSPSPEMMRVIGIATLVVVASAVSGVAVGMYIMHRLISHGVVVVW